MGELTMLAPRPRGSGVRKRDRAVSHITDEFAALIANERSF